MKFVLALILFATTAAAATRYVHPTGTNSGAASSWGTAWRTLTHAESNSQNGDTIMVGAGTYDEYVRISGITNLTWIGVSNATSRAFRISSPSNTISGMRLIGAQNEGVLWNAYVRIDVPGHWTTITNCYIGDTPQVKATNFTFNSTTDTIYSPDVDFVAAGFRTNGVVWWNGISLSNYWYANNCLSGTITGVTSNTLYIQDGAISQVETNTSVWSYLYSGSTYRGIYGVGWEVSGGTGATNCLVVNNLFTNMPTAIFDLNGHNHTIKGNEVVRQIGNKFIQLHGSGHTIVSNYVHDCILPLYYSAYELTMVVHPAGGGFYDFVAGFIHHDSRSTVGNTNTVIAWNWFENIEQPISSFGTSTNYMPEYGGMWITNNVFVGFFGGIEGGVNDLTIKDNTFYRVSYNDNQRYAMALGSSGITNVTVTGNLILDSGDHSSIPSEVGISMQNVYGTITTNNNLVVPPETYGGIIALADPTNPRGPDGIPWTDDDGLRPLKGSVLDGKGALSSTYGVHFRPVTHLGWHDPTGSNYSPAWQQTVLYNRTGPHRPYTNPPTLGAIPFTTRFEATNSVSGTWSTNRWVGIRDFIWGWGDGERSVWTRWPDVSRTYLKTGLVSMALTVTNSAGQTQTTRRNYRIAPRTTSTNRIWYVDNAGSDSNSGTNQWAPFATLTNALQKVGPGDYIYMSRDFYTNAPVDLGSPYGVSGNATNPITFVSYGTFAPITNRLSHWTWEGMEMDGRLIDTNAQAMLWVPNPRTNMWFRNLYFHHGPWSVDAMRFVSSGGVGPYNTTIRNCQFYEIQGFDGNFVFFSGTTNVTIDANVLTWSRKQADIRVDAWGANITRNFYYAHGYTNGNHADFIVYANPPGAPKIGNYLIERNWFEQPSWEVQGTNMPTQIANTGTLDQSYVEGNTNFVWRNNVFLNVWNGMNPMTGDGHKFYNNLFYQISPKSGTTITISSRTGSGYGTKIYNNIFYANSTSTNQGWYENGMLDRHTNLTVVADFNFVTHTNHLQKQPWTVGRPLSQYWGLWAIPAVSANALAAGVPAWDAPAQEINGINGGDPKFNDPATFDFRLKLDSPLLAGANLSAEGVTHDFWGFPRTAFTIGPFELADYSYIPPDPEPEPQPSGGATLHGRAGLRGRAALK